MGPCILVTTNLGLKDTMIHIFSLFFAHILLAGSPEISIEQLQGHLKFLSSQELEGRFPGSPGHDKARDYLLENLKQSGLLDVHSTITDPRSFLSWVKPKQPKVENIFGLYPAAKESTECVVFSAHYDHKQPEANGQIRPGADDNGSGVIALLELARLLELDKPAMAINVWFVFPDQEENYIAGSPSAVSHLQEKCSKIWANINLDAIGGKFFDGLENHLFELTGNGTPEWNLLLSEISNEGIEILHNDIYIIEPLGRIIPRSDYASFREQKIPFVFYTTGTPWYYHTSYDTEDRIDFPFLAKVVERLFHVALTFEEKDKFEKVGFVESVAIDYQENASRFADLVLSPLVDHQVENKISDEEALKWHERIAQLKDSEVGLKRWHIHQSILALFSAMEKRAEVEMGRDLDGPIFHPVHLK